MHTWHFCSHQIQFKTRLCSCKQAQVCFFKSVTVQGSINLKRITLRWNEIITVRNWPSCLDFGPFLGWLRGFKVFVTMILFVSEAVICNFTEYIGCWKNCCGKNEWIHCRAKKEEDYVMFRHCDFDFDLLYIFLCFWHNINFSAWYV